MLLATDLHLTDKEADSYRWRIFSEIMIWKGKTGDHNVAFLGDLTDSKDHHSAELVNKIVDHLHMLVSCGMEIYILMGNHDYIDPKNPFFKFLDRMEYITYISTPRKFVIGGVSYLFLPHSRNPKEAWKADRVLKWCGDCKFVLMHQSVIGSVTSNGYEMEEGLKPSYFKRFKGQVISGDIHVPQTVGPVEYVGSPYSVRFNDHFDGSMMRTSTDGIERMNTGVAGRRMLDISSIDEIEAPPGFQVKVRVHVSEIDDWPQFKDQVEKRCRELQLDLQALQLIKEPLLPLRRKKHKEITTQSPEEVVSHYGKRRGLSNKSINTGRRILRSGG